MIRINHLDKYFNKGKQNEIHVINDVSLELPDKGMVAIFGKSGCGKTTLLNVIGGLDKYASGGVIIENQEISNDPDLIRNKYMGYVFQNYNLDVSKSCFDNVADALRLCGVADQHVIERRVKAALRNVDMEKYEKRLPDSYEGSFEIYYNAKNPNKFLTSNEIRIHSSREKSGMFAALLIIPAGLIAAGLYFLLSL